MVMIAVVTSLAMRLPNPRMVAIDFIYGTLAALPLGLLYFLVIIPNTQQSMLLLCISGSAGIFPRYRSTETATGLDGGAGQHHKYYRAG